MKQQESSVWTLLDKGKKKIQTPKVVVLENFKLEMKLGKRGNRMGIAS
jgi:hypothetical protein